LRATDVAKDIGVANRVLVNGKVANIMEYNVAWNSRDADFLSVGETRGSGNANSTLNISARVEPHRFFEGTGIVLPVSYSQNQTSLKPRFTAGDDIIRTGSLAEASETRSTSRVLSTSYSRMWSERSNPLLRYTLGGVTASGGRATTESQSPTSVANSSTTTMGVNYNVALRQLMPIPLPLTKAQLFPLPERFYWAYNTTNTQTEGLHARVRHRQPAPIQQPERPGDRPQFRHGLAARGHAEPPHRGNRNLALEGVRQEKLGGLTWAG
jgi:cell surface protein SprA